MRFSLLKPSRTTKSTQNINLFPDAQHPGMRANPPQFEVWNADIVADLPLSPNPQRRSPRPEEKGVTRRASIGDRFSSQYSGGVFMQYDDASEDQLLTPARQIAVPLPSNLATTAQSHFRRTTSCSPRRSKQVD